MGKETSETISCDSEAGRGIQLCLKPEIERAKTWTVTSLCCSYCLIQVIFYLDRKISDLKRARVEGMGLPAVLLVPTRQLQQAATSASQPSYRTALLGTVPQSATFISTDKVGRAVLSL